MKRRSVDLLFLELGWFPQNSTFQLDAEGINADASWVSGTPEHASGGSLTLSDQNELLVLLQHESDTQITRHSPHFRFMSEFVEHLGSHSKLPLRIRQHPRFPAGAMVEQVVARLGMQWDPYPCLRQSLQNCRAVACINSSGAVEALAQRVPVLCFGRAIYRNPSAVYCMDHRGSEVERVTQELADGRCGLSPAGIDAMLKRIVQHQWTDDMIFSRLPELVKNILARRRSPQTNGIVSWRDHCKAMPTVLTTYLLPKLKRA